METTIVLPEDKTEVTARLAPRYKVLLHNDPITPGTLVIGILIRVFQKPQQAALGIMLMADQTQIALVDVPPLEQAEFRVEQAHSLARGAGFPLTFTLEKE